MGGGPCRAHGRLIQVEQSMQRGDTDACGLSGSRLCMQAIYHAGYKANVRDCSTIRNVMWKYIHTTCIMYAYTGSISISVKLFTHEVTS